MFITKENGKWQLRRTETRFLTWMLNGIPIRIGFRNRNIAASHKMQLIPHLSMKAIKRMYRSDTRRFNIIQRLNRKEQERKDRLKLRLRQQVEIAGRYLHNRSKLTFIS